MDKSFDFGALLRNNEKKHKSKPTQFMSVAGGVQKRLLINIKNRKSTRLTVFDSVRDLPNCVSPVPQPDAISKVEHRRQQLEKWKAEKEEKKKQQAAQKKKPFVAGVVRVPLKFEPPPPLPKPSTSGRVTRSQTRATTSVPKPKAKSPVKSNAKRAQSFAPKNASFKPPAIKNLVKLPILAPPPKNMRKKISMISFEPIMPSTSNTAKQNRPKSVLIRQNATEVKSTRPRIQLETKSTRGKANRKPSNILQSSSSGSDLEPVNVIKRIKTPGPRKSLKEPKECTPRMLVMKSTSEEKSSDLSDVDVRRKSFRMSVNSATSSSDKISTDDEPSTVKNRKSLHNISISSTSSSNKLDSDEPKSPEEPSTVKNRKSLHKISISSTESSSNKLDSDEPKSPIILLQKSLLSTPNVGIPKSESGSEEKLRVSKSPIKTPTDLALSPEQIEMAMNSPCVTLSRGKDKARKEMKWKIDEGLMDEDASDGENIDHFRQQLSSEIKRITEMCDTWDKIFAQTVLPEPVQEAVLAAVGQARLLMSQKLQQFASLVERCARPQPGAALVTPADLQGFWDMVFMQVENVYVRFKSLEELRARGWQAEQAAPARRRAAPRARAPPRAAASRIKDLIAAARKAKKEQEQTSTLPLPTTNQDNEKTFEAGFFCVRSPVKARPPPPSPAAPATPRPPATPARVSLLQHVLSNEAKKSASKRSTPFAMLRAASFGKSVECDGVAPLPQTPQAKPPPPATPGRSILKSGARPPPPGAAPTPKSVTLLLFHDLLSESTDSTHSTDHTAVADRTSPSLLDLSNKENSPQETRTRYSRKSKTPVAEKANLSKNESEESAAVPCRPRSTRKAAKNTLSVETEAPTPKKSARKKKEAAETHTPRRSGRNKVKEVDHVTEDVEEKGKRSTRKKALQELEANVVSDSVPRPIRKSSRRSRGLEC